MLELTAENAADYLAARGIMLAGEVQELAGGVACTVLAVHGGGRRVVVKQALERFKVADEWLVPRERVLAEAQALELMGELAPGSVPRVLDLDPQSFTLVMEAAPESWRPWKALLLEGEADPAVATRLGELLAVVHVGRCRHRQRRVVRGSARRSVPPDDSAPPPGSRRHDRGVHRTAAGRRGVCLVHGDYSPKNVLVGDDGLWVIDWEVVHRGDPAFDLAFLLNHLALKTIHRPDAREGYEACGEAFLEAYGRDVDMTYVLGLVGCLMLARVDGKSPAEYLTEAERDRARSQGIALLSDPPGSIRDLRP